MKFESNNKFKIMMVAGVLALGIGGLGYGYVPGADSALEAQCREKMASRSPELAGRCNERAFASAMTATDARSAARQISGANQFEILIHAMSMFALGLGAVLTLVGVFGVFGKLRQKSK